MYFQKWSWCGRTAPKHAPEDYNLECITAGTQPVLIRTTLQDLATPGIKAPALVGDIVS